MEAFDIFIRKQENNDPMITLTVTPTTTIEKIKKMISSECNFI